MIDDLSALVRTPTFIGLLHDPSRWESLIVNRRKPFTYRVFSYLPDNRRVCLHRFDPCHQDESFLHPHPWEGAFLLLSGSYRMKLGESFDRETIPTRWTEHILTTGSMYQITSPMTFHTVTPLTECHTIMLNGPPFPADVAHTRVRTTKGKDLDQLLPNEVEEHLRTFRRLLADYLGLEKTTPVEV